MSSFPNDPFLVYKRKGDKTDPFLQYHEPKTVSNGKVILTELPDKGNHVNVDDGTNTYAEITSQASLSASNVYYVDYDRGLVYFDASKEGLKLNFKYLGIGGSYIPATRVYTQSVNGTVTQDVQDMINNYNQLNGTDLYRLFDPQTGHKHTGASGDAPPIDSKYVNYSGNGVSSTSNVKDTLDSHAAQLADVMYQRTYLTKQGLKGDGTFRTIASVFPSVTLSQVQALNSSATLNNSADWYVIQNLLSLNVLSNDAVIVVDGYFIIDLPIVIGRNYVNIVGKDSTSTHDFNNTTNGSWMIKQIGVNQSIIKFYNPSNTSSQYITNIVLKDLILQGVQNTDGTKNLHGIEIASNLTQLVMDNVNVYTNGGSGFIGTAGHFVSSYVKNSFFQYNYDDGVHFDTSIGYQYNNLIFENVLSSCNGYTFSNGSYTQSLLTTRGHGFTISGTAISIIGGDGSINSGSGIYLNSGSSNGIVVQGRYAEQNKLADIYVTSGYKPSLDIGGNFTSSSSAQYGEVYYEGINETYSESSIDKSIPVYKYVNSTNKEITVSAIDTATGTFTSNGHGLSNGNTIYPIINDNSGAIYPINVYPGGLTAGSNSGYYVINATTNTFQLSSSSGGASITLSANANMDLTKWHFETPSMAAGFNASNLPYMEKCLIIVYGKNLESNASFYVSDEDNSWIVNSGTNNGSTSYGYNPLHVNGDVYNYVEIEINTKGFKSMKVKGLRIGSNSVSANYINLIDLVGTNMNYSKFNTPINQVSFDCGAIANGFTVEIYKL